MANILQRRITLMLNAYGRRQQYAKRLQRWHKAQKRRGKKS